MEKIKCDLCGELGDQADIQAFYDIKNRELIDVGECCCFPEEAVLLKEVLEENGMTKREFEREYGYPKTEWVFNLPKEIET